jgi:hypothetical protein
VVISARSGGGADVVLEACSTCDQRWWSRNGEPVDLRILLDEFAGEPAALRQAS